MRRELILCLNLTITFADEARDVRRRLGRVRERREVAALFERRGLEAYSFQDRAQPMETALRPDARARREDEMLRGHMFESREVPLR